MAINLEVLGPQNHEELEAFAIEALVFAVQLELQKAVKDGKFTFAQLAEKLDMSAARVSQIFSSKGANLTLKTIGRIAFALGTEMTFSRNVEPNDGKTSMTKMTTAAAHKPRQNIWQEVSHQDENTFLYLVAA
jgi:transcriptional regulator with XRE-family HTH domain